MRARALVIASFAFTALLSRGLVSASAAAQSVSRPGGIELLIEAPALQGERIRAPIHMVEVRGSAVAAGSEKHRFDLMIALDTSQSTRSASGADVDGDGEIGEDPHLGLYAPGEYPDDLYSTDPEDTVLAAEVAAANALLEGLSPERVRVGLLTFAGEVDPASGRQRSTDQQNARLWVPLSSDFALVRRALHSVLASGPSGATDFSAGIRLATRELAGLSDAASTPRQGAGKVILFMTDGIPTFPIGPATVSDPGDLEAAVAAARVAQTAGIRINSYGIGSQALMRPVAATEIARVTLGTFTPVLEPGKIVAALQTTSFANVEDVGMVNLTTREGTPDVRLSPDGSFVGFVPVAEGRNRVLVKAISTTGSEADVEIEFDFAIAQAEGRMLERELARLRRINRELLLAMESERVKREKRRQRMQTEIELRAERPEETSQRDSGR